MFEIGRGEMGRSSASSNSPRGRNRTRPHRLASLWALVDIDHQGYHSTILVNEGSLCGEALWHGVPIEYEIEKKLGIKGKTEVLQLGIEKYNEECRAIVMRFPAEWRQSVERLGRGIDFDNDYKA